MVKEYIIDGEELWNKNLDSDGWISKDVDTIINSIVDYEERKATENALHTSRNINNIVLEEGDTGRWKFCENK